MNKWNNGKRVLILTGMKEQELQKDIKQYEATGKKQHQCYLCKRTEGEASVVFDMGEKAFFRNTVDLFPVIRQLDKTDLVYRLCSECMMLLKINDKDRAEENAEDVFIPVCRN